MAARTAPSLGTSTLPRGRARPIAESATEPDGITRRVMLNVLEAFFRRPWLYALPLILLGALGVSTALSTTKQFRSEGSMNAERATLLNDLTQAQSAPGFTFETPATITARQINELLRSHVFVLEVAKGAGLTEAIEQDAFVLDSIRSSTYAYAAGDNLVRVGAVTPQPELSLRLAESTMKTFVQWVIDSDVSDSTTAERFLEGEVEEAEANVNRARRAVEQFLVDHPEPIAGERPVIEQVELDRLTRALDRAESRYETQLDKFEAARLATEQATTVVQQRLRTVDEPTLPFAPEPRLRKAILTVALFGVIGTLLSLALVALVAILDRSVRIPNDITAKFGLEVLAVVPESGR